MELRCTVVEVKVRLPCGITHPGLCPAKSPAIYDDGVALAAQMDKHVKATFKLGDFILVKTQPPSQVLCFMVGSI